MPYELVLRQAAADDTKAVGDNVFLSDLPTEFPVYVFYYPSETPDAEFERLLRSLGGRTGENLLVNIGRLDDPQFGTIVSAFGIRSFPVVVMTAVADLAAVGDDPMSAFVRFDKRSLADSTGAITRVEETYLLFIQGKVAEAIRAADRRKKAEVIKHLASFFAKALAGLAGYLRDRDISISILEGRFELKKSG